MIRCNVCQATFLSFEDDPGREQRVYDQHLPYCNAKSANARLKKKARKREPELADAGEKWETFES